MKEYTRNFMVGVFAFSALTALGVLMVWFGETPSWLQRSEWTLKIMGVKDIRGIGEGSPVLMGGVEIGRIIGLGFQNPDRPDRGVVVLARIKKRFSVPLGSIARVYGSMLGIGTGRVHILVPSEEVEPLSKDGTAIIPGEMASMLADVLPPDFANSFQRTVDNIGNLAASATPVADNLEQLLSRRTVMSVDEPGAADRGVTPNLSTAVERLDALLANLNVVLGDVNVQGDVKAVATNLRSASEDLKQTVTLWKTESQRISDNVNEGVDRTEDQLHRALMNFTDLADRLDRVAGNLDTITTRIAEGQGTAGKLVNDPRLYEAATLSFDRLSELLGTINRIAGKIEEDGYITVGQRTVVGTLTKDLPVGGKN